jgi:hypothetical protein
MRRRLVGLGMGALLAVTLGGSVGAAPPIEEPVGEPDLIVLSLTGPSPIVAGQAGTVAVTVKNRGTLAARNFTVAIYKHRATPPAPLTDGDVHCTVTVLAPGSTANCTGTVTYSAGGTQSLWAQVDSRDVVFELNEENNVAGPRPVTVHSGGPVGLGPVSVALEDFNGDRRLDLAVANFYSHTVSILIGDGTGGFGAATHFSVGLNPIAVAVGDLNGDGHLDLGTADYASGTVSILLGNGAGGFGPATPFPVGLRPFSLALGDLNEDGRLDLAAANYGSNTVSILLGNGTGGFGPATDMAVGTGPQSLALGDLNGDGRLDLAVANGQSDTVSIFVGAGTGGFGAPTHFAVGRYPIAVAIGDLNGDGRPDVAVANDYGRTISILPANGTGGFGAATHIAVSFNPNALALGGLNGDGLLDLAIANYGPQMVSVLMGLGGGAFAETHTAVPGSPRAVALGDVNADGKPDLAVPIWTSHTAAVVLNTIPHSGPALVASPSTAPRGATVTVSWGGISTPRTRDWVGLYVPGAQDAAFEPTSWIYLNTCQQSPNDALPARAAGSCAFTLPATLAPGSYELRVLPDDRTDTHLTVSPLTVQ